MTDFTPAVPVRRSGFIALLGRPNAGKSTLLNTLVGQKVAIVSPKPQTTRSRIMGVLTEGGCQMIFLDTPGVHRARTRLGDYMNETVTRTINDVDVAVLVIDATARPHQNEDELAEELKKKNIPAILAFNKTDLLTDQSVLLSRVAALTRIYSFAAVVPLSALKGDNVDLLKNEIRALLPEGPAFFPEDTLTDQPERVLVSELIREKLLYALSDELPHGIGVVVERMKERETGDIIDIDATIFCEKDSHKGMVIGKQGSVLKKVGMLARQEIETFLDCKVNLKLWVKVKSDWRNREGALHEMGYTHLKD